MRGRMANSLKPRPLATAVQRGLPEQRGFSLLGVLIVAAMSAAVTAVAYTAYTQTHRAGEAHQSITQLNDLSQRIRTSYAGNANFNALSTTSALHDGLYPKGSLDATGNPKNVWGGTIQVAGEVNGFAVTYENVDPNVCSRFVVGAARGWEDVRVNGASVMSYQRPSLASITTLCNQAPAGVDTVQFWGGRQAGSVMAALTACTVPPPQYQNVACPAGQISSVPPYSPDGITQQRDGVCLSAYGPSSWTPWTTIANTCAPICSPPANTTESQNQSATCPAGQVTSGGASSFTQTSTRTVTYACPAPTGGYTTTYGAWSAYSPTAATVCAPACVAPAPTTQTQSQTTSCPAGQVTTAGSSTFSQSQSRSVTYTCPAPTGAYTTAYGSWSAWSPASTSVCYPACVAPATTSTTQSQTAACPSGQVTTSGSGSFPQTRTATTTYSCPAPTGAYSSSTSYSAWTPTSSTVCAPACVAPASSSTTQTQTASCPSGYVTTAGSSSFTQSRTATTTYSCPSPTGAYTAGTSYTTWSPASSSVCYPACKAPANTSTTQYQTASCPSGQVTSSGSSSFTQSRTATTSYSCPAPTGSYSSSTTYSGWGPLASAVCAPAGPTYTSTTVTVWRDGYRTPATCASTNSCSMNNGTYDASLSYGGLDASFSLSCGGTSTTVTATCKTAAGGGNFSCSQPVTVGSCGCTVSISGSASPYVVSGTGKITCP